MYSKEVVAFVRAVQQGSFAKAGRELYLSGVSVKKQVDTLEARIGARLLDRSSRGVKLTDAGRIVYETAARCIDECDAAVHRARQVASDSKKAIRVGTSFLRPCDEIVSRWTRAGASDAEFRLEIVPFSEDGASAQQMMSLLGSEVDLFCGPCDSKSWRERCSVTVLGTWRVRVGVPRSDALARKNSLTWDDLEGRKLLLPSAGESEVLDKLRERVAREHPGIHIVDWQGFYDISAFNECAASGCLMETLDAWDGIHPSVATLPMSWGYAVPYGIVAAQEPSDAVRRFVELVSKGVSK